MILGIGRVSQIIDSRRFKIKATITGLIENVTAYPLESCDEPEVGEEIVLFELESEFGYSYFYKKARLFDFTRFKFNDCVIKLSETGIAIKTENNKEIFVSSSGDITVDCESDIDITIKGTANIKANKVNIEAGTIEFPKGSVAPSESGPFNCISVCPYTGAPHAGNIMTGG